MKEKYNTCLEGKGDDDDGKLAPVKTGCVLWPKPNYEHVCNHGASTKKLFFEKSGLVRRQGWFTVSNPGFVLTLWGCILIQGPSAMERQIKKIKVTPCSAQDLLFLARCSGY